MRVVAAAVVTAVLATLLYFNFQKGLWNVVQGWGRPYWWLDYRHGLVRRGLVGQVFQMVFGRRTEAGLEHPVTAIHLAFCAALGLVTLWVLWKVLWRHKLGAGWPVVCAIGGWIAAAQVWPTLAFNDGYMDVIVLVWAVAAALCVRAKRYTAASVLMAVGPFIHEYFAFLMPFVLAAHRMGPPQRTPEPEGLIGWDECVDAPRTPRALLWLAGVALTAALLATFAVSAPATLLELAAMPISAGDREVLTVTTLSQSIAYALGRNLELMTQNLRFTALNAAFFCLPSLIAVVGLLCWTGRKPTAALWFRAGAALFPAAALLLAWDLSRLLVMTNLTAGLLFLMTVEEAGQVSSASDGSARPAKPFAAVALGGALAITAFGYWLAPMAYVYYEPSPATLFPLRAWPGNGVRTFRYEKLWPKTNVRGMPAPSR